MSYWLAVMRVIKARGEEQRDGGGSGSRDVRGGGFCEVIPALML